MADVFFNQKGGVGKTTTALLFGDWLASKKEKTLLIDLDPQGTLTGYFFDDPSATLWDYLQKTKSLPEVVQKIDEYRDLLPASIFMTRRGEIDSSELLLEKLYFDRLMAEYDHVIIDCPPNLGTFSRLGLLLADRVFMPVEATKPSHLALEDALKTISTMRSLNNRLDNLIVFENRGKGRIAIKKSYRDAFKEDLGSKWLDSPMPDSTQVQEREHSGVNFFEAYNNPKFVNFFEELEAVNHG